LVNFQIDIVVSRNDVIFKVAARIGRSSYTGFMRKDYWQTLQVNAVDLVESEALIGKTDKCAPRTECFATFCQDRAQSLSAWSNCACGFVCLERKP
jgi:hypothetical protein